MKCQRIRQNAITAVKKEVATNRTNIEHFYCQKGRLIMGRRTKEELEKELAEARQTNIRQNDRINDLQNQLQGKIEDSPLYKTQIESFKIQIEALERQQSTPKLTDRQRIALDYLTAAFYEIKQDAMNSKLVSKDQLRRIVSYTADLLGYECIPDSEHGSYWYKPPKDGVDYEQISSALSEYIPDPDTISRIIAEDEVSKSFAAENQKLTAEVEQLRKEVEPRPELMTGEETKLDLILTIAGRDKWIAYQSNRIAELKAEVNHLKSGTPEASGEVQKTNTEQMQNGHRPGRKRKYDQATRQKIRELYHNGSTMSELSQLYSMSKSKVHAIVHELE